MGYLGNCLRCDNGAQLPNAATSLREPGKELRLCRRVREQINMAGNARHRGTNKYAHTPIQDSEGKLYTISNLTLAALLS